MTAAGVTAWITKSMQFRQGTYQHLFDQYVEARRVAEGTAAELAERLKNVAFGSSGNPVEHLGLLDRRRFDVGLAAEALMLPLDALLTSLRFGLTGNGMCTDDGPELRNGVTVDRAVDAIGNYVRHRDEWFSHDYAETWPNERQMRSVRPLALLYSSQQIEDARAAYMAFTSISLPPAFVLDLLGDYEALGAEMTWRVVESRIYAAALRSIERRFA
jgi:hypothetical protein